MNNQMKWDSHYNIDYKVYPNEYVTRIFMGKYPTLCMKERLCGYRNKKVLVTGFGDGRDIILLSNLGFDVYGTEISEAIVEKTRENLLKYNIDLDEDHLKVGTNEEIPFSSEMFDCVLSWNSIYYLSESQFKQKCFDKNVAEVNRVLRKGGQFVFSIPTLEHDVYKNSEDSENCGYRQIVDYYFSTLNGSYFKTFASEEEVKRVFFMLKNWSIGEIHSDCFGVQNHWYIGVAEK